MGHNRVCIWPSVVLYIIIIGSQVSVGFGQSALCVNPLNIGELRVRNSKQCVDIDGSAGFGNVQTSSCDGLADQQMIMCGDGTIRNEQLNYCLQLEGHGDANVKSDKCGVTGNILGQLWYRLNYFPFVDNGGIEQVTSQLVNYQTRRCLDVAGVDGKGNIGVVHCDQRQDQYFYIRSRGRELHFGRLKNEASGLCLDVEGSDGRGDVGMSACEDSTDQWFRFYDNGELVNEESGWCVDVVDLTGAGNVVMHPCEDETDQMWYINGEYCNGETFCSFLNVKSGNCLDVEGHAGKGNVGAYPCERIADQRFEWVAEKWVTPTASWESIGCNQNGKVTHEIIDSVFFSTTITSTMSLEISSTMEATVSFLKSSVSTKVAHSLANAWMTSRMSTQEITFTCENYDSGEAFTGGCMWQLKVDTTQVVSGENLTWKAQIVKCTPTNATPQCPPFTKCRDKECTMCENV